jgi:hypothetical protein
MPHHPPQALLQLMCSLEISLHESTVRADKLRLAQLLHDDFVEIGRSGQRYNKAQMLAYLLAQTQHPMIWSQGFELTMPAYSVALLTYQSAQVLAQGELAQHSQRSSLWQFAETGWQLRHHQGTPCTAFAKNHANPVANAAPVAP